MGYVKLALENKNKFSKFGQIKKDPENELTFFLLSGIRKFDTS